MWCGWPFCHGVVVAEVRTLLLNHLMTGAASSSARASVAGYSTLAQKDGGGRQGGQKKGGKDCTRSLCLLIDTHTHTHTHAHTHTHMHYRRGSNKREE